MSDHRSDARHGLPKLSVRAYTLEIEKPSSSRFSAPGGPVCPNCTLNKSRKTVMKGPVEDPSGKTSDLYFICERCKWKMKDRRGPKREST